MYTHLLLISTVQISRAYCSFFYYNIFLVSEQVFCVIFYEFEQIFMNLKKQTQNANFILRVL